MALLSHLKKKKLKIKNISIKQLNYINLHFFLKFLFNKFVIIGTKDLGIFVQKIREIYI